MTRKPTTKITAEDAYGLLIDSVIEFLNTAMLVESEITKLRLRDKSDDFVPGTMRTHRDMWVSMKTVSHFNFGIALELMLKLLLYAHGKDVEKWHSLPELHDDLPLTVQEELDATYRGIRHGLIDRFEIIAHISLPPSEPPPEHPPSLKRDLSNIRKFFEFFDKDVRLSGKRYSYELVQQLKWRLYLNDLSVFFTFIELVMGNIERYIDLEAGGKHAGTGTGEQGTRASKGEGTGQRKTG